MSVHEDTDTEVVVYIRLLDKGTDVWRPVRAAALPDGTFRLLEPDRYDPSAETWEFPPVTYVAGCSILQAAQPGATPPRRAQGGRSGGGY